MRGGVRRVHTKLTAGAAAVRARGGRRLSAGLGVTVLIAAAVTVTVVVNAPSGHRAGAGAGSDGTVTGAGSALAYERLLSAVGARPSGSVVAQAAAVRARLGETEAEAARQAGLTVPAGGVLVPGGASAGTASGPADQRLPPVGPLQEADLFVVAPQTLPAEAVSAIAGLPGVAAVNQVDAARIEVNGGSVATLGVDPATFRPFAAGPTATSTALWQNVAAGDIAVSYLMGEQDRLPLGGQVTVVGAKTETLAVGGFGTVGITGVDAVVSEAVARSLGMPAGNALVVSAPHARLSELIASMRTLLPASAAVAPLVAQAPETGTPTTAGLAGAAGLTASSAPTLTVAETKAFLTAAVSRLGMPYVWGGSGPSVFDCSGLVQWSMRQAGIVMPRVAAQQAQTGPSVPVAGLEPGDLLFYHTDPTAPDYISHVAIYLGGGLMVQAPEPGKNVEVVAADFGAGFAGAVRVDPQLAAAVAGQVGG